MTVASRTRLSSKSLEVVASPHSPEAEMAVLGAILLGRDALAQCRDVLPPDAFFRESHQRIYDAAVDVASGRGEEADLITVTEELRRRGELEEIGGPAFLAALLDAMPTTATVARYARIVAEKARARRAMVFAARLHAAASTDNGWRVELAALVEAAGTDLVAAPRGPSTTSRPLADVVDEVGTQLARGQPVPFVMTPWPGLNYRLCGGFLPGELCYLGARPGVGKTALALELARHVAKRGTPVLIVSREMILHALTRRMLAQEGQIHASLLRRGSLGQTDWPKLTAAAASLHALPIWLTDQVFTIDQMRDQVARHVPPPGLVIVDYLQLIRARATDRRQEVEAVSQGLKALAMQHKIPVVCLSSLARAQAGSEARPTLASLRESGALEHDADFVILLHRKMGDDSCEVIVAKARDGMTGTVHLRFRPEYVTFDENGTNA